MDNDIKKYQQLYKDTLLKDVIPFWEKQSIDKQFGGYFTCLDRAGNVYDTDKFVWLQARQMWTFSMLYNKLKKKSEWLEVAKCGADFLANNGTDEKGDWYFSLNRAGEPLVQPCNIFSDCFAAMAFSQYALASGDEKAKQISLRTYHNILRRKSNPKGKYNKQSPETRPLLSMAMPMILANLSLEMKWLLDKKELNEVLDKCVEDVMGKFLDKEQKLLFEYTSPDKLRPDCFDGRLINPGHGIEAMWFLMDIGQLRNDQELINKAVDLMLSTLEFGWDGKYGGIFYFMDAQGKPLQQLEWDQKLWWVHLESLVALSMGYSLTGRDECWQWYQRVHEYTWRHFSDPKFGEWFGYLNRQGERLLDLKGGKWKGCFHVPRALYLCWRSFQEIENVQTYKKQEQYKGIKK